MHKSSQPTNSKPKKKKNRDPSPPPLTAPHTSTCWNRGSTEDAWQIEKLRRHEQLEIAAGARNRELRRKRYHQLLSTRGRRCNQSRQRPPDTPGVDTRPSKSTPNDNIEGKGFEVRHVRPEPKRETISSYLGHHHRKEPSFYTARNIFRETEVGNRYRRRDSTVSESGTGEKWWWNHPFPETKIVKHPEWIYDADDETKKRKTKNRNRSRADSNC